MSSIYPPPNQILSALGIDVVWDDDDGSLRGRVGVGPELLGRPGLAPGMGALFPVVDIVAGTRASRHAEGDWLVTSDAWMHERRPVEGEVEIETGLLRAGKRSIVVTCEILAGGRPAASATVEFTRIRREAAPGRTRNLDQVGAPVRIGSGPLLDRSLVEACGIEVLDAERGTVELARSPFVHNSIGTLQGGAVALLADVAAAAMVGQAARVIDLQYRFLAQTGPGPARTSGEVLRVDADATTVGVSVVDSSSDELVGWAVARVT